MIWFKGLKPSRARIILFLILILFLSICPLILIKVSLVGFRRISVIASCLTTFLDKVDTAMWHSIPSALVYALIFFSTIFLIYSFSCIIVGAGALIFKLFKINGGKNE